MTRTASTPPELDHAAGCPAERLERLTTRRPTDGVPVTIWNCLDCPARRIVDEPPIVRLEPLSPEWLEAWEREPHRLYAQATPEERQHPERNPLHHLASATHPASRTTRPGGPEKRPPAGVSRFSDATELHV